MSRIIAKESLTAYERWELPNVGKEKPEEDLEPIEVKELLSAEKLEQIRNEAYQEGFEQGRREGLAAGEQEIQARVHRLTQILDALLEPLKEVDERVEEELVALAVTMTRHLVRRELRSDPGQIVAVVREALAILPSSARRVQLYLHPDDSMLVQEKLSGGDENSWRIVEDAALTRGGCRVTAEHSRIDATVEKRLAAVISQVLGGEREDDL